MARILVQSVVNPTTGAIVNSFSGASAGDTIEGVILRKRMCAAAYSYDVIDKSLAVANGNITSITVPTLYSKIRSGGATAAPGGIQTIPLTGLTASDGSSFVGQRVQLHGTTGSNLIPANATIAALPSATAVTLTMDADYTSDATTGYEILLAPQTILNAVLTIQSSNITKKNLTQDTDFTVVNNVITLATAYTGNDKITSITYKYIDAITANLVYDVPVYPSNTLGSATMDGSTIILWNQGMLAQAPECWATSGTVNSVIEALITDA